MNKDKIDHTKYRGRVFDDEAFDRLTKTNQIECEELAPTYKDKPYTIKTEDLSDESLLAIQEDYAIRLSRYNTESFALKTKIKKIDRILKLRKKPILDD